MLTRIKKTHNQKTGLESFNGFLRSSRSKNMAGLISSFFKNIL